jgi:hypothetical protein
LLFFFIIIKIRKQGLLLPPAIQREKQSPEEREKHPKAKISLGIGLYYKGLK